MIPRRLVWSRATHPAFEGPLSVEVPSTGVLVLRRTVGDAQLSPWVDRREGTFRVA